MKKKQKDEGSIFKAVCPELWKDLFEVLLKVVGESVKDKIAKAILVGALSAAGNYAISSSEDVDPHDKAAIVAPVRNENAP